MVGIVRKAIVGTTATAVLAVALIGGTAGTAAAYTRSNSGACWGRVDPSVAVGTRVSGEVLLVDPFYVWRAKCHAGTQKVTVTYRTWGYDFSQDRWVVDFRETVAVWLEPGEYGDLPKPGTTVQKHFNVSLDVVVKWKTVAGVRIGRSYINYDAKSDYYCAPETWFGSADCAVYSNPQVGAYVHFFNP